MVILLGLSFSGQLRDSSLTQGRALIITMLYRDWETFQRIRQIPGNGTMVFRVLVFSLAPAVAFILSLAAEKDPRHFDFVSIVLTHSMPTFAAATLGTQRDIIQSWYFCYETKIARSKKPILRSKAIAIQAPLARDSLPRLNTLDSR
ncbi:hypothetical protein PQX77_009528 [Marasmius sp. AFHP31]|nr:hypothetical protein PQX77_009528 [Marasmius sp. AFHP31]